MLLDLCMACSDHTTQVCESLGVPLEVVPMTTQYWERVVSHSVSEIRAGRTPNPDMLCNSRVKFGAFLDFLEEREAAAAADGNGSGGAADGASASSSSASAVPERYDRIASGHYARVVRGTPPGSLSAGGPSVNGNASYKADSEQGSHFVLYPPEGLGPSSSGQQPLPQPAQGSLPAGSSQGGAGGGDAETAHLCLTPDAIKDQTYFLAHLSPRQLGRTLFPLGALTKAQVGTAVDLLLLR
jgi:tRNA-specific 2-thiouridylase